MEGAQIQQAGEILQHSHEFKDGTRCEPFLHQTVFGGYMGTTLRSFGCQTMEILNLVKLLLNEWQ